MATDMQKANGEGAASTGSDGLRGSVPSEQGSMVRPGAAKRIVASSQSTAGGAPHNQTTAQLNTQNRSVPRTLHRVSFSAAQVDSLAKKEALIELRKSGLAVSNEMHFAHTSTVVRTDDGGLYVEVHS